MEVTMNLNNIKPYSMDMISKGFYIKYKKETYFVTCNHSFSIKSLKVNDKTYTNFTNCLWNELVYFSTDVVKKKDHSIFSIFSVKQIDSSRQYFINNKEVKYIGNDFLPLHMLPKNPNNLYYRMKIVDRCEEISEGDSGSPVYDSQNRLIGIFSKIDGNYIYVIPSYYLQKTLTKLDNKNIYTINENLNKAKKIDFNLIKNNKIYHKSLKIYLPLDCFLNLELDKNKRINITKEGKSKIVKSNVYKNDFNNSYQIEQIEDNIYFSSSFLRYLKVIEEKQLIENFESILNLRNFKINLNNKSYNILFN